MHHQAIAVNRPVCPSRASAAPTLCGAARPRQPKRSIWAAPTRKRTHRCRADALTHILSERKRFTRTRRVRRGSGFVQSERGRFGNHCRFFQTGNRASVDEFRGWILVAARLHVEHVFWVPIVRRSLVPRLPQLPMRRRSRGSGDPIRVSANPEMEFFFHDPHLTVPSM